MASVATDSLGHVDAVIEVDEIGKVIHACPDQRLSGPKAFAHWLQHGRLGPDLRVAVHAGFGGRDACKTRNFHRSMAVPAINSQAGYVMLVTERHWLGPRHAGICDVGRALDLRHSPEDERHDENRAEDGRPRNAVSTAMKNLGHR